MSEIQKHKTKSIAPPRVNCTFSADTGHTVTRSGVFDTVFPRPDYIEGIQNRGGTKTQSTHQRSQSTPCRWSDKQCRGEMLKSVVMIQAGSESELSES